MKQSTIPHDINTHSFKGRLAGSENAPENQEKLTETAAKAKPALLKRTKDAVTGAGKGAVSSIKSHPKTSIAAAALAALGAGTAVALAARATKKASAKAAPAAKLTAKSAVKAAKTLKASVGKSAKAATKVTKKSGKTPRKSAKK